MRHDLKPIGLLEMLVTRIALGSLTLSGFVVLIACNSELQEQKEIIRQQRIQIAEQEKEKESLIAAEKKEKDCARAFREYFDKAQLTKNRNQAISLYRDGLAICPDDDVAHYELGRTLAAAGRLVEAENSFEAALKINPNFTDARKQLEAIRTNR
jgi:tetratricopeptide (TPR) repeat protein